MRSVHPLSPHHHLSGVRSERSDPKLQIWYQLEACLQYALEHAFNSHYVRRSSRVVVRPRDIDVRRCCVLGAINVQRVQIDFAFLRDEDSYCYTILDPKMR